MVYESLNDPLALLFASRGSAAKTSRGKEREKERERDLPDEITTTETASSDRHPN